MMAQNKGQGQMTVKEAGRKGGQKVKQLIEEGKKERSKGQSR